MRALLFNRGGEEGTLRLMRRAVVSLGQFAIPAGHRVEVFIVRMKVLLSSSDEPIIYDRDTSVWYGLFYHLAGAPDLETRARAPGPVANAPIAERFTARVLGSVVAIDPQATTTCTTVYLDTEDGGGS